MQGCNLHPPLGHGGVQERKEHQIRTRPAVLPTIWCGELNCYARQVDQRQSESEQVTPSPRYVFFDVFSCAG